MKLGLGSAQFGSDYGVTNKAGKVPLEEISRILRLAADNEVAMLDTAAAYGESEAVLGKALWPGHPFRIVTKCAPLEAERITPQSARRVRDEFLRSLERLRQPGVHGLLVHQAADLVKPGADLLVRELLALKAQGLVSRVGASFYSAAQIDAAASALALDLVQVPLNVLDQRLIADGTLQRLRRNGVEIHARSIFLQGLLLVERVPPELARRAAPLQRIDPVARAKGISRLELALGFVAAIPEVDVGLVGVTSEAELAEILAALRSTPGARDLSHLASDDEELLNPSRWPRAKAESDA